MSFVIIQGERYALELGQTVLGGTGADALAAAPLAGLPPFAAIDYPMDGASTIRALGGTDTTINGSLLTAEPRALRHGDQLAVAGVRIAFGEMRRSGRTSNSDGVADAPVLEDMLGAPIPTAATGGRLIGLHDGVVHPVPAHGLTIGREPDSGLVLESSDVSRRHAVLMPGLLGYQLSDTSVNGVQVNGARVDGTRLLGQSDVIQVGALAFRFEADAESLEPDAPGSGGETGPAADPAAGATGERVTTGSRLLASLEVITDGPTPGARFRIERPTVQLGRGPGNDIRLANDSVSSNHASLVLRGRTWHLHDLESRNGTYVDGIVVREPRPLPAVCELRLGALTMVFRAIGTVVHAAPMGTIGIVGLGDA